MEEIKKTGEGIGILHSNAAFLGVENSFTGQLWTAAEADDRLALALAQRTGLPEILGRVMASRGVGLDNAEVFLRPTLRALLPDPESLKDMNIAAERLARAIMEGDPVAVFGDYDVDGATSAALLIRLFRALGRPLRLYVPDRVAEGYGPNAAALRMLAAEGIKLLVTVDCGTTAYDALAAGIDAGLEILVIDHHTAQPRLPPALAIVNPNRLDEANDLGNLAAVGVVFLLAVAVNRALRNASWYNDQRPEPDLLRWLDLVALGTVCDVVRLSGLNRALVAQGLKIMARRSNPGLHALAEVALVKDGFDAYTAGFLLGPRVNAGGRVGAADLGSRLLATDDAREAAELARQLDAFNAERKEIEAEVLDQALLQVDEASPAPLVMVAGHNWHAGVIGIVAARLKERYRRPALVVALDKGVGKGSGRSVRGVDLGSAIIAARQYGVLTNGGGHAMAAGFSLAEDKLDEFRTFMSERISSQLPEGLLKPTLILDGLVSIAAATPSFVEQSAMLGPFGAGNPEPRFAFADCRIVNVSVVGEKHVRCVLSIGGNERVKAIAFRAMDNALGEALLRHNGKPLHIAGHLRLDRWNGNDGVQMLIDDAASS